MSRWDCDTVFYRVFCITLLAVAFTFTVILTNVFVDIDGLLSDKDKDITTTPETPKQELSGFVNRFLPDDKSEDVYEDKDYQDSTDLYRSKRSLGSQDLLFQIKDPTVTKILTNRLTTLLDELDEEETNNSKNDKPVSNESKNNQKSSEKDHAKNTKTDEADSNEFLNHHKIFTKRNDMAKKTRQKAKAVTANGRETSENSINLFTDKGVNKEELLHLAMHNIILQGIIGNMKMESVYKKIHDLVMNFEKHKTDSLNESNVEESKHSKKTKHNSEELKLIDELVNCKDLQKQIVTENIRRAIDSDNLLMRFNKEGNMDGKHKDPNVIIKTIIDITGPNDKKNSENILNHQTNINGVVKLVYNGKSIRFKRIDEPATNMPAITEKNSYKTTEVPDTKNIEVVPKQDKVADNTLADISYKRIIQDYIKRLSKSDSLQHDKLYSTKRLKRHIKIRYENKKTTPKPKHQSKKEDDELFVEIETHFDSHGTKGEKKKKLIKELIDKIKKAIRSDSEGKTRTHKHLHVKKRIQDPLDNNSPAFVNSVLIPLDNINHRQLDPISKSHTIHEKVPYISDNTGEKWKKKYDGPGFLLKTINSAELSTVDTEYNKEANSNNIPQRLQLPLNTDSDEISYGNSVDLGKIKFLVKDIEGSGFSVGFNQFQGELPDPDTIKLFTGLENVIQTYHQKYDQEVTDIPKPSDDYDGPDINADNVDDYQDPQDNPNEHLISRRSIKTPDETHHHLNEYKKIVTKNILPYSNYEDIYNKGDESYIKRMADYLKLKNIKDSVLVIDENVFEKDLKPAEIFSIADLFKRRKRSTGRVKVRQISNINSKKKISRYINTKSMAAKSLFMNNKKRNKRQIEKIRIVARDTLSPRLPRNSEEDIFVVSDEKVFADRAVYADRAVLRQMNVPEAEHNENVQAIEHYDIIAPQKIEENHYDIINHPQKETESHFEFMNPYPFEEPTYGDQSNTYMRHSRLSALMSKYPHIIMEETNSKEEPVIKTYRRQSDDPPGFSYVLESTTNPPNPTVIDISSNVPEIGEVIAPQDRGNYKVTVKIRPKNSTLNSGFKEIHTSINKSYNKNGLVYTSLVNVSEVSKVEKLNKNSTRGKTSTRGDSNLQKQQQLLKSLIQQHRTRIEDQLKHLNNEKQKLDKLNVEDGETLPEELLDMALSTQTSNVLSLIKEEVKGLTTEKAIKTTEVMNTTPTTTTTTTTTKKPRSTTEYIPTTTVDTDKIRIITTIERNENLTQEILKKIDKNTGILEVFLDKLINKIYVPAQSGQSILSDKATKTKQKIVITTESPEDITHRMANLNTPYYSYGDSMPNFFNGMSGDRTKNHSFEMPYLYAYQHPFDRENKAPMTNAVYQNHIHTNTPNRSNHSQPQYYSDSEKIKDNVVIENDVKDNIFFEAKPGEKVINNYILKNNTRFYMDELNNDYRRKMIPMANKHLYNTPYNVPTNRTNL